MDIFYFVLLIVFVTGILLVIYSVYNFDGKDDKTDTLDGFTQGIENKLKAIDISMLDADNAITELNDISKTVFKELDVKYEELLFLYSLIDEKKNELNTTNPSRRVSTSDVKIKAQQSFDYLIDDKKYVNFKNMKYKAIMALKKEGLSLPEIARKLDMGQGEVMLIMELGKERR